MTFPAALDAQSFDHMGPAAQVFASRFCRGEPSESANAIRLPTATLRTCSCGHDSVFNRTVAGRLWPLPDGKRAGIGIHRWLSHFVDYTVLS